MQAIRTQYFGPSNVKGSRIKATCAAKSITIGYVHALSLSANHRSVAEQLITKLGWTDANLGLAQMITWIVEFLFPHAWEYEV